MLVLAIDTATPTVTAGVVLLKKPHEIMAELQAGAVEPLTLLAEHTVTDPFGHAEHLTPLITAVLTDTGHAMRELDAVVVGVGPGPFTGLRVGIATAAAIADALDIPAHGVPSHDAIAVGVADPRDLLVVTDARRKEVYVTAYSDAAVRRWGPVVLRPADLPGALADEGIGAAAVAGAGAPLVSDILGLPVRDPQSPVSRGLVQLAARQLLTGAVPTPLTPLYLRRPDAAEPGRPKPALPVEVSPDIARHRVGGGQ